MEAIRNMYAQMGVDNFYKEHGNEYKNPPLISLYYYITHMCYCQEKRA